MTSEKNAPGHRMEEVVAFREGQLAGEARREFEAHLAGCPACTADLAATQTLLAGLRERTARGLASGHSTDEILARMKAKERELARAPVPRPPRLVWAGVGLALVVALFALAWLLQSRRTASPERQQVTQPKAPKPSEEQQLAAPAVDDAR